MERGGGFEMYKQKGHHLKQKRELIWIIQGGDNSESMSHIGYLITEHI